MISRVAALVLAGVLALQSAQAQVWTFEPVSSTVWIKGTTQNVTWRNELDKGAGIETIDIELGTGGANRVTILETVVKGLPWPATTNYMWTIPDAAKYKQEGQVFCLHYVGRGKNLTAGGVEAPKDSWSTWFALVNNEATYSRFLNLPTATGDSVATTTANSNASPTTTAPTTTTTSTASPASGTTEQQKPVHSAGRRIDTFSALFGVVLVAVFSAALL